MPRPAKRQRPCVPKTLSGLVEQRIGQIGAMIALIWLLLATLASPFKSKLRLEAENAVLRRQLIVLRRKLKSRARLTNNDRWLCVPKTSSELMP
jgi:hypothetical protein